MRLLQLARLSLSQVLFFAMEVVFVSHEETRTQTRASQEDLQRERVAAVGYLRVSTEDQAREGYSLDAQRACICAYCAAKGYDLIREFDDDGFSGRTMKRPAFLALMQAIRDGLPDGRHIGAVVAKFDRLNRNLYEFLATQQEMQRHGVNFASVGETIDTQGPFGRFFVQIIAAFAELESGIIGERVRHGMREKAMQGGFNGMSAPFGYDIEDGGLVVNEREASVVRTICTWKRQGRSFGWIVGRLNARNVSTKKGKRWTKRQIFRIVHSPLYRGHLHWAGVVSSKRHPAIVTWTPVRRRRPS